MTNKITIQAIINQPVTKVWELWTMPEHIKKWNNASDDWHTPLSENDLRVGGKFLSRMAARDGSMGFDFSGVYDVVEENSVIEYRMEDGRQVHISFIEEKGKTIVTESFDPESENDLDMQREGWQAILDNFKKYAEAKE